MRCHCLLYTSISLGRNQLTNIERHITCILFYAIRPARNAYGKPVMQNRFTKAKTKWGKVHFRVDFASLGVGGENKIQTLDYNIPLRIPPHIDIINYFESPFIQLAVHSKVGNVVLLLDVPLLFISFGVSVFILALVKIHPGFNDELDVVCRQAVDACLSHFFRNLLGPVSYTHLDVYKRQARTSPFLIESSPPQPWNHPPVLSHPLPPTALRRDSHK